MIFSIAVAGADFLWTESELSCTAKNAEAFIRGTVNIPHSTHGARPTRCEHYACLVADCISL